MGQAVGCNRTVIKLMTVAIYLDKISGSYAEPLSEIYNIERAALKLLFLSARRM